MKLFRRIGGGLLMTTAATGLLAATFGRVVPLVGGASDIVLDEVRQRVYLTSSAQNQLQVYSLQRQSFQTPIATDSTPISAALSRDGRALYVTCFDAALLDVINLDTLVVTNRIALPAKPEGVAVAQDGRVLISTTGSSNGTTNVLLLYDPSPTASIVLRNLTVAPPAPTPPVFPPPSSRPFLSVRSQLLATRSGATIVGVNVPAAGSPTVFVYEAASGAVLRSRAIIGSSNVLSIADDGSRFMAGLNLFDTATLQVLAQQNLANSPYPIDPRTNFNLQSNQGGSVFAPDGQTVYTAFDVAPVQVPPAASLVTQMMLSDPDNLLIRMGLQLPENLAGKMVISADGSNIFALSDSGFVNIPVGSISQSALASPATTVVLLTRDQCGVTSVTSSATVNVNNPGRGRVTANAQLLQYTGLANQASPATAPSVRVNNPAAGPQLQFGFNSALTRGLGTITPPHDFLVQSPEAVNIPDRVRVYENNRDSDARGAVYPIAVNAAGQALPDLLFDQPRGRIYVANPGLNRIEVFDTKQQRFLPPIKVGQLPISLALTPDGGTLYVANAGGENISIVDPDLMRLTGRIAFPPIPFNSNQALTVPTVISAGISGPLIVMSNGSLWKVVGTTAIPRGVSKVIGQTAAGLPNPIPVPASLAATPGGEFILVAANNTGFAYLYDATQDDFVAARQVFPTLQTGYNGPLAAGPRGQYFVWNGVLLNQALVPGRTQVGLVSAVTAVDNGRYALFSPPAPAAANTLPTATPIIQLADTNTGNPLLQVPALEGPSTAVAATARGAVPGRTMAIDAASGMAYVITTSGLSAIPLVPVAPADRPQPAARGAVNLGSYQTAVAQNGLLSIFGQNMGSTEAATSAPLPTVLGGTCVTLNNSPLPLFWVSPGQINAQIPPNLAPGSYPLVVRSIAKQAASTAQNITVSKYAPAVLVAPNGQLALFHENGSYVNKDNPATRDEPLVMYAVGLGPTTGGAVTAGMPSPSSPLAKTDTVEVFFGDYRYKQAEVIVDFSGLTPNFIGLYQLNLRVPGFHMSGEALPVMLRMGTVTSPLTGPVVPIVAVD